MRVAYFGGDRAHPSHQVSGKSCGRASDGSIASTKRLLTLLRQQPDIQNQLEAAGSAAGEQVRHLILGTLTSVKVTIRLLHKLGYAEPNDWNRPISTGR
ncbi:MAG: hypothetical protein AAF716_22325, partial [Cyanobacteria bacterium P01_D01_bin.1]